MEEQVKSSEEVYTTWYLNELLESGHIVQYKYQPKAFILSEFIPIQKENKALQLHKGIVYTADYLIEWADKSKGIFIRRDNEKPFNSQYPFEVAYLKRANGDKKPISYIDVKGTFNGRNNTSAVTFPIKRAWVYQRYCIYIQMIIPVFVHTTKKRKEVKEEGLFPETFTPERYFFTDGQKQKRKLRYSPMTLKQYLKSRL
jgi:hypothetical protein